MSKGMVAQILAASGAIALGILGEVQWSWLPALLAGYWGDDYFFASKLYQPASAIAYYDFGDLLHKQGLAPWWMAAEFRVTSVPG